tara:strand:+ start:861 stop:1175 length:315 start_codon:yes stop_codon:yes gene_type:complete
MAEGKKYGGRVKGTPNKSTQSVNDKLAALGCDPIEGLVKLAVIGMESQDYELAFKCLKELAQYALPKRKAIEIDLEAHLSGEVEVLTDQEIIHRITELAINDPE